MGLTATIVAGRTPPGSPNPGVTKTVFGKTHDGREAHLFTLTNKSGMEVAITDFGGTVVSIKVPDRNGKMGDVILGYDNVEGYETGTAYIGATVGRYANRIGGAKFSLDGTEFTVPKNDGPNHLHGVFNKVMWDAKTASGKNGPTLHLHYLSKDGEEGYPGNLSVNVIFTLTNSNELTMEYSATTDKKTVLNLTNHCYFNLEGSGNILETNLLCMPPVSLLWTPRSFPPASFVPSQAHLLIFANPPPSARASNRMTSSSSSATVMITTGCSMPKSRKYPASPLHSTIRQRAAFSKC